MSKVDIENYRGIAVWFDTDNESFQCDIDDERSIKKSYSAIKKFIDDWKKDNEAFRPFKVEPHPISTFYGGKKGVVIGVRKDGRYILQDDNGKKEQISDYHLDGFILSVPANIELWGELKNHTDEVEKQRLESNAKRKEIEAKFKITTLKEFKQNNS